MPTAPSDRRSQHPVQGQLRSERGARRRWRPRRGEYPVPREQQSGWTFLGRRSNPGFGLFASTSIGSRRPEIAMARQMPGNCSPAVIPSGVLQCDTMACRLLSAIAMEKPVVLITGALTGIGRATAIAFAQDGARLVVSGRRETEGKAVEAELRSLGAEAAFIQADVRHDDEVRDLVDKTVARFGRIDAAVNNAGTEGQRGLVVDQTAESYAATFDTNLLSVLLSMNNELRGMRP